LLEHTAGGLLEHTAGGLLEHTAGGSVEAAAGGAWAGGAMRRALTEREVMAAAAAAGAHWKEGKTPAGQPVGNVDGDPSGGGLGGGPGRGRMVYRRGKCWASRLRAREGASRRRAGCATRR
ncbi:MAG: hypothetical protein IT376_13795, partial [Polyangiaceae bacterium]|nr:hypothetical protein [Polyangiaceae bacterium]